LGWQESLWSKWRNFSGFDGLSLKITPFEQKIIIFIVHFSLAGMFGYFGSNEKSLCSLGMALPRQSRTRF
jgi:hypothetical protein